MFAKIKSSNFIDALHLEVTAPDGQLIRGILRDDKGKVCRTIENKSEKDCMYLSLFGLSDLPYGRYTLELSQGANEIKMNVVKRV